MSFLHKTHPGRDKPDKSDKPDALHRLIWEAAEYPKWRLTPRQHCDLTLLLNGGFAPLNSFVGPEDYESILDDMHLAYGALWPIPITLDVTREFAKQLKVGDSIALLNVEDLALAALTITDIWEPDREREALCVYGTKDDAHPGVHRLLTQTNPVYISGSLRAIHAAAPLHPDLQHTPAELKKLFKDSQWETVVAFQTRNPLHHVHLQMLRSAMNGLDGLLIHPVIGPTRPGDIGRHTRVRCYKHALKRLQDQPVKLSLLPLAMRMAGPREAVWHGLIRANHGCTHMVVGRDHAGPGEDASGKPFYGMYEAIELFQEHADKIGVEPLIFEHMVYDKSARKYAPDTEVAPENKRRISGSQLRRMLEVGEDIPEWYTDPEVAAELHRAYPPLLRRGFTVFFTGLSGSGKSTLAKALIAHLMENDTRVITLLDGDDVRSHLSSELGFSREHRALNVRRIGFVADLITKTGGIAVCAPIAPYEVDRNYNRETISASGGYIQVYVNTPLEVCRQRDVKGHYKRAAEGQEKHFTGVSDPYEAPPFSEVVIDTSTVSVREGCERIVAKIREFGYLK